MAHAHDIAGTFKAYRVGARELLRTAELEIARGSDDEALLTIVSAMASALEECERIGSNLIRDAYPDSRETAAGEDIARALVRAREVRGRLFY